MFVRRQTYLDAIEGRAHSETAADLRREEVRRLTSELAEARGEIRRLTDVIIQMRQEKFSLGPEHTDPYWGRYSTTELEQEGQLKLKLPERTAEEEAADREMEREMELAFRGSLP